MIGRLLEPRLLVLLLALGCTPTPDKGDFGPGGTPAPPPEDETGDDSGGGDSESGGGDSGDDTGTTDTTDTHTGGGGDSGGGESGGDSGGGGDSSPTTTEGSFDEEGDVVAFEDSDAVAEISLADESGDSNLDQEFYLVFVNTEDSAMGYQLRYTDEGHGSDGGPGRPSEPGGRSSPGETPFRATLRSSRALGELRTVEPPPAPPPALGIDDIGETEREFRVRNDLQDDETYTLVDATLWAVGDSVAIWVDNDVPIDWDYECDGLVDQEDAYDAYGFDNCDLQTIADIVDSNIFPNVSALYGDVSDVNGDGLVSVVITPVLNVLPLTSEDEEDYAGVVESYADPEVDLTEWDADTNPGSNEQEVIYVFAPDPYGYYNSLASTTIDEYTAMSLAAQIARAYEGLISYNQHVLESGGEAEESWMDAALGSLAADLVGFGAVYYDDAWKYLDAPHLYGLTETEEEGSISSAAVGAQYLFARWLVDTYGTEILANLVQTSSTGTDAVEEATGEDFADLVVRWQVALLTTGVTLDDGSDLVSDSTYTPYAASTTISAPTSDPLPGDYYGANGYQMGINLRGQNLYMDGGTTDSPHENEQNRVTLDNTDHFIHVTGLEFFGYTEGNYAAQVVRLAGLPYAGTGIQIQGEDQGFVGAIVRWKDPDGVDIKVEDIFSPTDSNDLVLPTLPSEAGTVYGLGSLSDPGLTTMVSSDGEEETVEVPDTDRWLIDLTDRAGELVPLAIKLSRRYGEDGEASPEDPWLAVVPAAYVPTPTVDGTTSGTCDGGATFAYPSSMLEYLYYQVFLSSEAYGDDDEYDACGTLSESATTCDVDWDLDGVLDEDEPQPDNFLEQVWVMQCTLAGGDAEGYTPVGSDVIDEDSTDDDDAATYDLARNLGGTTDGDAEDAFLEISLAGGYEYILVVGATDGGTGTYELAIQTLDDEG